MKMRASEALMAGSLLIKARPYLAYGDGDGCALGMIHAGALGVASFSEKNYNALIGSYPWMREIAADKPCNCLPEDDDRLRNDLRAGGRHGMVGLIAHLFNEHVMAGRNRGRGGVMDGATPHCPNAEPWTLERLAQWIESVDPTPKELPEPPATEGVSEHQAEEVYTETGAVAGD